MLTSLVVTLTDIRLLALVTDEEGLLHNNHQGFPRSQKLSVTSSEYDPAWWFMCLLTKLKLAWPFKTIEESKFQVQQS